LGELLGAIKPNIESSGRGTIEKKPSLPVGIDKRTSHQAQTIASNQVQAAMNCKCKTALSLA